VAQRSRTYRGRRDYIIHLHLSDGKVKSCRYYDCHQYAYHIAQRTPRYQLRKVMDAERDEE
jgi:hypothetical protein